MNSAFEADARNQLGQSSTSTYSRKMQLYPVTLISLLFSSYNIALYVRCHLQSQKSDVSRLDVLLQLTASQVLLVLLQVAAGLA